MEQHSALCRYSTVTFLPRITGEGECRTLYILLMFPGASGMSLATQDSTGFLGNTER